MRMRKILCLLRGVISSEIKRSFFRMDFFLHLSQNCVKSTRPLQQGAVAIQFRVALLKLFIKCSSA